MHKQYLENLGFSWWYDFDSLEVWTWKTNIPDDEYQEALYKIRKNQPNTFLPLYREEKTGIWHNNKLTITVEPSQFNHISDSRKIKDGETTTFILTKTSEGIEAKSKQEGFTFVFFNEFDFDVVIETLKKENTNLKFEINDSRKMKDYGLNLEVGQRFNERGSHYIVTIIKINGRDIKLENEIGASWWMKEHEIYYQLKDGNFVFINDSKKVKYYFGRQLFEDVYVLDEFIINGQKFYLLEGFYVKNDTIAYAITSDYNGESYWNGAGTILENEQEARQMIQEMKGSIKDSKKMNDEFFGQKEANEYQDLIYQKLAGKKITKRKDLAQLESGIEYEARRLGIDTYDLIRALEGMRMKGLVDEFDDSSYYVIPYLHDSKKEQSITDSLTYDEFAGRYNKFENRTKKRTVDFRKVKDSDYVIPEELEYGDMIVGDFNINLGNGTEKRRMTLELKQVEGKKYYFTIHEYGMNHLTYEINEESLRKAKANYV